MGVGRRLDLDRRAARARLGIREGLGPQRLSVGKSSRHVGQEQVTSTMSDHSAPASARTARTFAKTGAHLRLEVARDDRPVASCVTPGIAGRAAFARPDAGQEQQVADASACGYGPTGSAA